MEQLEEETAPARSGRVGGRASRSRPTPAPPVSPPPLADDGASRERHAASAGIPRAGIHQGDWRSEGTQEAGSRAEAEAACPGHQRVPCSDAGGPAAGSDRQGGRAQDAEAGDSFTQRCDDGPQRSATSSAGTSDRQESQEGHQAPRRRGSRRSTKKSRSRYRNAGGRS